MAFDSLPLEILKYIFNYLDVSDKLVAGTVCKKWYYACINEQLVENISITLKSKSLQPVQSFVKCERPFSCLTLQDVTLPEESGEIFKGKIGERLKCLIFKECNLTERVFFNILSQCKNLQSLHLVDCGALFFSNKLLDDQDDIRYLSESLKNVTELNLCDKYLSDLLFCRISQILVNISSLSMRETQMSFYPVVYKRFYPGGTTVEPSHAVLTFENVFKYIKVGVARIKSLDFSESLINDTALERICTLDGLELEAIYLSSCVLLTAASATKLCRHQQSLKKLDLSGNLNGIYDDHVFDTICSYLSQLEELYLRECDFVTDSCFVHLQKLKNLSKLDIQSCRNISSNGFIKTFYKYSFPKMKFLNLCSCKIDDHAFIRIASYFPHLTYLDISCTCITDESINVIFKVLKLLRVLKLSHCQNETNTGLIKLYTSKLFNESNSFPVQSETFMKEIDDLFYLNNPSGVLFRTSSEEMLTNIKGLRELDVSACKIANWEILMDMSFMELKRLDISYNTKITDETLANFAKHNRSLEVIILRQCINITDNGIANTLLFLPRLTDLNLEGCPITDKSLSYIGTYCAFLKDLNVIGCSRVTSNGVKYLEQVLPRVFIVSNCDSHIM